MTTKMTTEMQLLATFKTPVVPLVEISERYLNLSPQRAMECASMNRLPFPTFRLTASQKAPRMVNIKDLAAHIDACHEAAAATWENSQV